MNAIQKFIEAEHKYLDLNEIDYKEYEQMVEPLRDVECVVRCKDCKYSYISEFSPTKEMWCCGKNHILATVKPDFYCADGERKDSDGDV